MGSVTSACRRTLTRTDRLRRRRRTCPSHSVAELAPVPDPIPTGDVLLDTVLLHFHQQRPHTLPIVVVRLILGYMPSQADHTLYMGFPDAAVLWSLDTRDEMRGHLQGIWTFASHLRHAVDGCAFMVREATTTDVRRPSDDESPSDEGHTQPSDCTRCAYFPSANGATQWNFPSQTTSIVGPCTTWRHAISLAPAKPPTEIRRNVFPSDGSGHEWNMIYRTTWDAGGSDERPIAVTDTLTVRLTDMPGKGLRFQPTFAGILAESAEAAMIRCIDRLPEIGARFRNDRTITTAVLRLPCIRVGAVWRPRRVLAFMGGVNITAASHPPRTDVWLADLSVGTWTHASWSLPEARHLWRVCIKGLRMFLLGGYKHGATEPEERSGWVAHLDEWPTVTWHPLPCVPVLHGRHVCRPSGEVVPVRHVT